MIKSYLGKGVTRDVLNFWLIAFCGYCNISLIRADHNVNNII